MYFEHLVLEIIDLPEVAWHDYVGDSSTWWVVVLVSVGMGYDTASYCNNADGKGVSRGIYENHTTSRLALPDMAVVSTIVYPALW